MLTLEQIDFLLTVLANTAIGGGLIDIAYETKKTLLAMKKKD